jgi:hypothetical protein
MGITEGAVAGGGGGGGEATGASIASSAQQAPSMSNAGTIRDLPRNFMLTLDINASIQS